MRDTYVNECEIMMDQNHTEEFTVLHFAKNYSLLSVELLSVCTKLHVTIISTKFLDLVQVLRIKIKSQNPPKIIIVETKHPHPKKYRWKYMNGSV